MNIAADSQSGRLLHLGALRFSGADAASFLQGQISCDTRRLAQAHSLLAAYSNAQGRALALLHVLPHSSGIVAILPRELVAPTLESLRKYVLRARVDMEDASDLLWVYGQHGFMPLQLVQMPSEGYIERDGVGVATVGKDATRHWIIGDESSLARQGLAGGIVHAARIEHDWRLADIRAGLPQIYLATREAFVAQMLNLDLLDGISFSKGCYTGQEIFARTQHLGRIKRRLYRLQLPEGQWSVGQTLRLTDGRSGRLVEVARIESAFEALAVLNVDAGSAGAGAGETGHAAGAEFAVNSAVAARQLPLPYALS